MGEADFASSRKKIFVNDVQQEKSGREYVPFQQRRAVSFCPSIFVFYSGPFLPNNNQFFCELLNLDLILASYC